jgi:hypothetical protein
MTDLKPKFATASAEKNNIFDIPLHEHLARQNLATLPQSALLTQSVNALGKTDLVEAYLRGSFSSGEADELSDIDLFLVVKPEYLAATYDTFVEQLNRTHPVLVSCHDKLVKDYGGIGFMFICKGPQDRLYQFDLYMAMKGVPPKAGLVNCPRIFTKNPAYSWLDENGACAELPETARNFIARHSGGDSKADQVKYYLTDLMVTLHIMKKHLKRGQFARALNDNNHAIGVSVELLRTVSGERSHHTALYAADKLVSDCINSKDPVISLLACELQAQFLAPLDQKKIGRLFSISESLARNFEPDAYRDMEAALKEYRVRVLGGGAPRAPQAPRPAP